jgi:hypothetical protein
MIALELLLSPICSEVAAAGFGDAASFGDGLYAVPLSQWWAK